MRAKYNFSTDWRFGNEKINNFCSHAFDTQNKKQKHIPCKNKNNQTFTNKQNNTLTLEWLKQKEIQN